MKILMVISSLGSGGAERLVVGLIPYLNKYKDVNVDLFVLNKKNSFFSLENSDNCKIFYSSSSSFRSINHIFDIAKVAKEYDLIHAHLFYPQYYCAIGKMLNLFNKPLIMTEHSTNNKRRNKVLFKFLERTIYSQYQKVICISEGVEESLINWQPNLVDRTLVISNGIDIKKFREAKAADLSNEILLKNGLNNTVNILMIGTMDDRKDHATLIKAISLCPENYHLFLIGDGPLKEDLKLIVEKNKISRRVHFLGRKTNVEEFIKGMDLFVLSSKWEGFGLVAIEAMAGGIPVIVSNVEGLEGVVENAAIKFEPGNPFDLKQKIEWIINSEETYDTYVGLSKRQSQKYDISNTALQYIELYNEVILQ